MTCWIFSKALTNSCAALGEKKKQKKIYNKKKTLLHATCSQVLNCQYDIYDEAESQSAHAQAGERNNKNNGQNIFYYAVCCVLCCLFI